MPLNILVIPDKFKGTLTAQGAADAMARGWRKVAPDDTLELIPMSDGGDGFGEIISSLIGAKPKNLKTIDAAHRPIETTWWWEPKTKTAIIESARIIGLAMLPAKKFHPFQLDTFGLGKALLAAKKLGCKHCLVGIGGSATNDGGFGLARSLGWKFLDSRQTEITEWTDLCNLDHIVAPKKLGMKITVAVDVQNPLLGLRGATRTYGPQKGLRVKDSKKAESALARLAKISNKTFKKDFARIPGAGAAGGLGFGLMAFAGAKSESGFALFAREAKLEKRLRKADLVLTGEGSLDAQTLMGKGVGQIASLCRDNDVPCIGIAGSVSDQKKAEKLFSQARALTEITSLKNAKLRPAEFIEKIAVEIARS